MLYFIENSLFITKSFFGKLLLISDFFQKVNANYQLLQNCLGIIETLNK